MNRNKAQTFDWRYNSQMCLKAKKSAGNAPYDKFAHDYEAAIGWLERVFFAGWRERALASLPPDARLLEIGAGTGLNFAYYPPNSRGAASELSVEMLGIARRKATRPAAVTLVQADAQHLPFANDTFDAAFATLVFCSVPDPLKGLREARRVVKPGGKVILFEHVRPAGLLGFAFDVLNLVTVKFFDDHFNRRTAETARRAGLEIETLETHARGIFNLLVCKKAG